MGQVFPVCLLESDQMDAEELGMFEERGSIKLKLNILRN